MSYCRNITGSGNVNAFLEKLCLKRLLLLCGGAFCDSAFDLRAHLICELSDNGTLVGGKSCHSAQHCRQLTFFPKVTDSERFQIRVGCVYAFKRFRTDLLNNFFHL